MGAYVWVMAGTFQQIQNAINSVVGSQTPNSPYGNTIGWYNMSPTMAILYGVDAVADDILVRITTPYLWFDPTFGYDVTTLVNSSSPNPTALIGPILRQIQLDPRVNSATGSATFDDETLTLDITVKLTSGQVFSIIGRLSTIDPSQLQFSYSTLPSPV